MEDFPSPGVKMSTEVKVNDESEKILADLSEDERENNSQIASGAAGSQDLVGDVQPTESTAVVVPTANADVAME